MRCCGGRKHARAPMALPQGPSQRWSPDFLSAKLNASAIQRAQGAPHRGFGAWRRCTTEPPRLKTSIGPIGG